MHQEQLILYPCFQLHTYRPSELLLPWANCTDYIQYNVPACEADEVLFMHIAGSVVCRVELLVDIEG
jgi:hypothetical protein